MQEENNQQADALLKKHFARLPKVVQNAITSAHVEKHLRLLANKHRLHLDQWQILENEVVLTLMGLQQVEDLQKNIKKGVGVDDDTAKKLAEDIAAEVFEPIRKELERELEHPQAEEKKTEPIEDLRAQILARAKSDTPTAKDAEPMHKKSAEAPIAHADKSSKNTEDGGGSSEEMAPQQQAPPPKPAPNAAPTPSNETEVKEKNRPESTSYTPGKPSVVRKDVTDDPYREPVDE